MKKHLLSFIICFTSLCTSAQINYYLQNSPEWIVMRGFGGFMPCIEYDTVNYYLNGDSIINTLTYKQVWKCGHKWYSWMAPPPNNGCNGNYTYCDTVATGFVRSQGLQMYYIPRGDTAEQLLYDFNLTVGSLLPQTYTYCCPGMDSVTSIDSIYTPYGYRKRFHINNGNEYLVEGIGSIYGFIEPYGIMLDNVFQLICYDLNDTAWFPSQGPGCSVMTAIPTQQQPEVSLQLIPNPATDYVDVTLTGTILQSVVVYDVFGKVVKQQTGESKLFVGDLTPGIYLIRVSDGTSFSSSQLIIE